MNNLKLLFIVFFASMSLKSNLVLSQDEYDDIAPSFGDSCPPELQVFYIDKCQRTYFYNYTKPTATDNSNQEIHPILVKPDGFKDPPFELEVGIYNFRYVASDEQENKGYCEFAVLILMRPSCPNEIGLPSNTSGLQSSRTCGNRYGSKASYICMKTNTTILEYSCNRKGDWKKIYELNEDGSCEDTVQNDVAPRFDYCPPAKQVQYVGECCDKVKYSDIPRSATDSNNKSLDIVPHFSPDVPKPEEDSSFILLTGLIYDFRYDATDKKGNTATCSFRVVVLKQPSCANDLAEVPPASENDFNNATCGQQYGSVFESHYNTSTVIRYKCLNGEWTEIDKDEYTNDSNSCPPSIQIPIENNEDELDTGEVVAIALCSAVFGSASAVGGVVVYKRKKNDSEPEPTFDNPLANRESSFRSDSLPVILSENNEENNRNMYASVA